MPRESAADKAARYLVEGRLQVVSVDDERIVARCRGSGTIYDCGLDAGGWHCACPARTDRCAHLRALRRVTVVSNAARWRSAS